MLKNKKFYFTWIGMYLILIIPNVLFQMRSEKKIFQEMPFVFFGTILIAAFICSFVIHKNFINQK